MKANHHKGALALAGAISFALFSTTSHAGDYGQSAMTSDILDAASQPHVIDPGGYATADWVQIVSIIVNHVFSDDGGPVDISQASLEEIRNIVREENFLQDKGEYIAKLQRFTSNLKAYHSNLASAGYQSESSLAQLIDWSQKLTYNTIYFNDKYEDFKWRFTTDFGLIASYMVALSQEETLLHDELDTTPSILAASAGRQFQNLGSIADRIIAQQVRITQWADWNTCGGQVRGKPPVQVKSELGYQATKDTAQSAGSPALQQCDFVAEDAKAGRSVTFDTRHYGVEGAFQKASNKVREWRAEHKDRWKGGNYSHNLQQLQNFETINRSDVL